jgi:FMN phosphatase YigB (HAD superfamily)
VSGFEPGRIAAITFDFGNTLVPVGRAGLRAVVDATGRAVVETLGPFDLGEYLRVWSEERERQFREEVPQFRETDLGDRFVRVLAGPWHARAAGRRPVDQASAARLSTPARSPGRRRLLVVIRRRLPPTQPRSSWTRGAARDRDPLELAVRRDDRPLRRGDGPHAVRRAIVVSQRVGVIKPHPEIFAAAGRALDDPPPDAILHVGDDWAADVVGAARAGWRVAYVDRRPADSPLPTSERDGSVVPDLEIGSIAELGPLFGGDAPDAAGVRRENRALSPG